jgi:proline iminopeptidase
MDIQSRGKGPVRIFLAPGGPGLVPAFYDELTGELSRRYRVTVVSFSGTSPQPATPFPATIEAGAAELAEAIAAERDDRPAVILGHSYGGAVAIELLASLADRHSLDRGSSGGRRKASGVDGAIILSGFPSGRFIAESINRRMEELPASFHEEIAAGALSDPERILGLMTDYWFPRYFCRVPWPDSFHAGLANLNPEFMYRVLGPSVFQPTGSINDWDREDDLATISQPMLILGGEHDYFRPEAVRALPWGGRDGASTAAGAGKRTFFFSDHASHSLWIEDPEAAYREIDAFIAGSVLHES